MKASSVTPLASDMEGKTRPRPEREKEHPLCCLNLSRIIMLDMRREGVLCLEDLEDWTDQDFKRIRGLGHVKIKNIREILKRYGIGV